MPNFHRILSTYHWGHASHTLAGGEIIHKETWWGSPCQITEIQITRLVTPSIPPLPLVLDGGAVGLTASEPKPSPKSPRTARGIEWASVCFLTQEILFQTHLDKVFPVMTGPPPPQLPTASGTPSASSDKWVALVF